MNFIPKYMRNPTWYVLGLGSTGFLIYMVARQNIDRKFKQPIIEESLNLLENNPEVFEVTGAPLLVEPKINNSASIGDDVMNFSFTVRGPRGKMNVELGADSRPLRDIGMSQESKNFAKKQGINVTENIYNQSYNNYYVIDRSVASSITDLEEKNL